MIAFIASRKRSNAFGPSSISDFILTIIARSLFGTFQMVLHSAFKYSFWIYLIKAICPYADDIAKVSDSIVFRLAYPSFHLEFIVFNPFLVLSLIEASSHLCYC